MIRLNENEKNEKNVWTRAERELKCADVYSFGVFNGSAHIKRNRRLEKKLDGCGEIWGGHGKKKFRMVFFFLKLSGTKIYYGRLGKNCL
jgi:hypothetical protein